MKVEEAKASQLTGEMSRAKLLKRAVLGLDDESAVRTRKRRKGVNPLACKKRRRETNLSGGVSGDLSEGRVPGAFGRRSTGGQVDHLDVDKPLPGKSRNAKKRRRRKETLRGESTSVSP